MVHQNQILNIKILDIKYPKNFKYMETYNSFIIVHFHPESFTHAL